MSEVTTHGRLSPHEIYSGPTIIVRLGEGEDAPRFGFHRALAMEHSGWFRSKFQGEDPELHGRNTHMIILHDVDQDTFVIFLEWIYKQTLAPVREWVTKYNVTLRNSFDEDVTAVYIFAHEYSVPALEANLMKLAVDRYKTVAPRHTAIVEAFARLPKASPFLQLLVDSSCINGGPDYYDPKSDSDSDSDTDSDTKPLPISFLVRVAKKYAELASDTVKGMQVRKSVYMKEADDVDDTDDTHDVDDMDDMYDVGQLAKRQRTAH